METPAFFSVSATVKGTRAASYFSHSVTSSISRVSSSSKYRFGMDSLARGGNFCWRTHRTWPLDKGNRDQELRRSSVMVANAIGRSSPNGVQHLVEQQAAFLCGEPCFRRFPILRAQSCHGECFEGTLRLRGEDARSARGVTGREGNATEVFKGDCLRFGNSLAQKVLPANHAADRLSFLSTATAAHRCRRSALRN